MLLNIAFWALKYNKDVSCRDSSKKPAYVYISQENDLYETMERAYSYAGAVDKSNSVLSDFTTAFERFQKEFKTEYGTIIFMYRKKNQLNTNDVDNFIGDIEAEGEYEVKLVIHDYLKRIQPTLPKNDLRIDLGEAANDFSNIAKARRLPIITANQLNRAAYQIIESGNLEQYTNKKPNDRNLEKKDLGRGINLSMQSESSQISENVDAIFAIVREFSEILDQEFLGITDLKQRGAKGKRNKKTTYFAHPFEKDNSMKLVEDVELDRKYSIDSIAGKLEGFATSGSNTILAEDDTMTLEEVFGD